MTPTQAKELLPIIQAYAEGKTVQRRIHPNEWCDCTEPAFTLGADEYRIKHQPTLIPWTADTVPMTMPVWVRHRGFKGAYLITHVRDTGVTYGSSSFTEWQAIFSHYDHSIDGKTWHPCGTVQG